MKFKTALLLSLVFAAPALAQGPATPGPFVAGRPLGLAVDGAYEPMSSNVKVYGAAVNVESCSYDPVRKLIILPSRGAEQTQLTNDAFVSLLNHDGSVHTSRWIGVNRNGLTLNHPFGSEVFKGKLYLADRDGGTSPTDTAVSVIRMFDMATGAPAGEIRSPESTGLNDIAIAADGTIYGSQTGGPTAPMKLFKITPDGKTSVFVEGPVLKQPNGVAMDNDGNIAVLNMGSDEILTFTPDGKLAKTEHAAMPGNDGLVIMKDGTKYVSSVQRGGITRLRPGRPAELIARGIPSAASMCFDPDANQLVIPMNPNNAVALIKLN
jgi:hypothetical protein